MTNIFGTMRDHKQIKVLVSHQGCIPIYRKSFFSHLNSLKKIQYIIVHGDAPSGTDINVAAPPYEFPNLKIKNYELRIAGQSFIWQPIIWKAMRGEFDAAVIGDDVKFLSNFIITLILWIQNRPVIFWGFGYHQYSERRRSFFSRVTGLTAGMFKKLRYRLASGYLAYTEGGARALRELPLHPQRIAVLRNTIDTNRERKFGELVRDEPIESIVQSLKVRANTVKLLYVGRLVQMKCVDILIEYAELCRQSGRDVDIIIFGQGSEEQNLRTKALGLENVTFHKHDDMMLARALRVSAALVVPGALGLAVTHGFAHGVPTLTRLNQLHGPEIEYIEDGVNGQLLPESRVEFLKALDLFVDDKGLQKRLAIGAEKSGRKMDMDHMVAAFHGLVSECLVKTKR